MNPSEQRARHTAVASVARRQADLEADLELVLEKLATEVVRDRTAAADARTELAQVLLAAVDEVKDHMQQAIDRERGDRFLEAQAQRTYVDDADARQAKAFDAFLRLPLWSRLRWIVGL